MQRLHQDDLAGTLLQSSDDWLYLKLPAIATGNERAKRSIQNASLEKLENAAKKSEPTRGRLNTTSRYLELGGAA